MKGILYAVGVGPGDPELLTLKAVKEIKNADCIACPESKGEPGKSRRPNNTSPFGREECGFLNTW